MIMAPLPAFWVCWEGWWVWRNSPVGNLPLFDPPLSKPENCDQNSLTAGSWGAFFVTISVFICFLGYFRPSFEPVWHQFCYQMCPIYGHFLSFLGLMPINSASSLCEDVNWNFTNELPGDLWSIAGSFDWLGKIVQLKTSIAATKNPIITTP